MPFVDTQRYDMFDYMHPAIPEGGQRPEIKLVAEPASPAKAGCLSGPAGLGGITSLVIIPAYMLRLRLIVRSTDFVITVHCALRTAYRIEKKDP